MNDVRIGIIPYKYLKCHYGIGIKPEYDMKPENELKHGHIMWLRVSYYKIVSSGTHIIVKLPKTIY